MEEQLQKNIRLGIFVTTATLLLMVALYFVGSKQNLFGSTIRLTAFFHDVNGLMPGNNVRFAGIDVGTVKSLDIENDSTIKVTMILDSDVRRFIRQHAVATIGTDGLMGNKLVNIESDGAGGSVVYDGAELKSNQPVKMDDVIRTLSRTNTNIADISSDLSGITSRIRTKNSFLQLLSDTLVAGHIQLSILNLKETTAGARSMVNYLNTIARNAARGKSSIGQLLADTFLYKKLLHTMDQLEKTGDSATAIGSNLSGLVRDLKQGNGSIGQALRDTLLIFRVNKGLKTLDTAAFNFNENMVALQHTWPFKKYFRKKRKNNEPERATTD